MKGTRAPVDLPHATRLLNHGPVTIVTSAHGGRSNVMAAAWTMPLDFDPPKVAVVIDSRTLTRQLVDASGVFGLQIPDRAFAQQTLEVGSNAGVEFDKFAALNLQTFQGQKIDVPMLAGCVAWLECKVIPDDSQRYDLFLAEVVAAYADSSVYSDNRWHFGDDPNARTVHYVAGGTFFTTGEAFEVKSTPLETAGATPETAGDRLCAYAPAHPLARGEYRHICYSQRSSGRLQTV